MYKYNTSFANNCDRMIIKWLSKVRVDKIYLGHPGFADDFAGHGNNFCFPKKHWHPISDICWLLRK